MPHVSRFVVRCLGSLLCLLALRVGARAAGGPAPLPHRSVQMFDLADVRLGSGPFFDAMQRDEAYLLRLDPDRLLHTFRLNVGLPSHAEPYGGWEGPTVELRGHTLGHYLSACSLMYRSTGEAEFKRRVDGIVAALAQCQAASTKAGFHEGYLAAFPESFIDRVEQRKDVWAPWYTLHKILAGLIDANQLTGNAQALEVAEKMAGWIRFRVDRLSREQMQASLQTEFGGMNEALANLYAITKNPDHLRLAQAFDQAAVFDPLARGEDKLDGLHANTQIPKVIGAAREYELTGDARYRAIATTFWDRVALHRSYAIGGDSDREHFFPVDQFARHVGPETAETCNTYNMLKLTRHLFEWDPKVEQIDFYERALFNDILASQDPAQGMFVYLMSLEPGSFKSYSTPENSFWCCVGTGMENHAKYAGTIYAHTDRDLLVNLFVASEVTWRARGVTLRQETRFPDSDAIRLIVSCNKKTDFALRIRHPSWAVGALDVRINGKLAKASSVPGSYLELKRTWKSGDAVDVRFPMSLRAEPLPGNPQTVALLYGPIVLAGKLGIDGMPSPYVHDQLDVARFPHPEVPAFVTADSDWLRHVELVSRDPLLFRTDGLAKPRDVMLAPFNMIHHERNAVYWQVLTPEAWNAREQQASAALAAWKHIEETATDHVVVGDEMQEGAHQFAGDNTQTGIVSGRGWRLAQKGGFFSYTLHTGGAKRLALACAFGSRDVARTFDVMVDGVVIASPRQDGTAPGEIYVSTYELPETVTRDHDAVTVRFQAASGWDTATATVFGCALEPLAKSE